jgi:hypothetical protein
MSKPHPEAPAAGLFGLSLASELFAPAVLVAEGCPTLEQFEARMCAGQELERVGVGVG